MSKYKSQKVKVDGITFDSQKEAARYCELKLLLKAGKISNLNWQVPFELQPAYKKNGKGIRNIKYIADFTYTENGLMVVEDTKGFKTKEYLLKKKMFEFKYTDLTFKEI